MVKFIGEALRFEGRLQWRKPGRVFVEYVDGG